MVETVRCCAAAVSTTCGPSFCQRGPAAECGIHYCSRATLCRAFHTQRNAVAHAAAVVEQCDVRARKGKRPFTPLAGQADERCRCGAWRRPCQAHIPECRCGAAHLDLSGQRQKVSIARLGERTFKPDPAVPMRKPAAVTGPTAKDAWKIKTVLLPPGKRDEGFEQ